MQKTWFVCLPVALATTILSAQPIAGSYRRAVVHTGAHVIFQNCAGGGGRLDLGILRRFHNTELSDWMRAPRGLKILNGITWILPPEILLRTFGTEVGDHATDGDIDLQLRTVMLSRPIFRGISPSMDDFNPLLRTRIRDSVELFKKTVRPIMVGSRVYHHTPLTPLLAVGGSGVCDAGFPPRGRRTVSDLTAGRSTLHFPAARIGCDRKYKVTWSNRGQTAEIPGERLLQEGITVRLETNLTSEMLLFDSQ